LGVLVVQGFEVFGQLEGGIDLDSNRSAVVWKRLL
jgi:hypothetical protein